MLYMTTFINRLELEVCMRKIKYEGFTRGITFMTFSPIHDIVYLIESFYFMNYIIL